jgi:hypothetical protein
VLRQLLHSFTRIHNVLDLGWTHHNYSKLLSDPISFAESCGKLLYPLLLFCENFRKILYFVLKCHNLFQSLPFGRKGGRPKCSYIVNAVSCSFGWNPTPPFALSLEWVAAKGGASNVERRIFTVTPLPTRNHTAIKRRLASKTLHHSIRIAIPDFDYAHQIFLA